MPIVVTPAQLALIIVIFVAIFGTFLAGLSYLMWRRWNEQRARPDKKGEKPPEIPKSS